MAKEKRPAAYLAVQVEIGQRLRWARELVMPSRADFARLIGIDRSTLAKIEDGRRAPSVFLILDVAHKLRMTPDYFLTGCLIGSNGELASRLATAHPELLEWPRNTGKGTAPDTSERPMKQEG